MVNHSTILSSGAKTRKPCFAKGLQKDQINELPDDILVNILSNLKIKEAGRTSVLSKRWRYVWPYVPVLNFDVFQTILEMRCETKFLEIESPRYIHMVNHVLRSYQRQTAEEFTVRFEVNNTNKNDIDNWVKFAMEKRVKRLELDFTETFGAFTPDPYTFPNLHFCDSLTSLKLSSVNVTGDVIENFFKTCPQLETVQVILSDTPVNLKVASFKLKHLEINRSYTKYLNIFAPNLVSFKYCGGKIGMPFRSTTKLAELVIGGEYAFHLVWDFSKLSSHLSQLEMLALDLRFFSHCNITYRVPFPECKMIKRLELIADPRDNGNLFGLTSIIKACPFMHKLVLKIERQGLRPCEKRKQLEFEACPHYHLKVLEFEGFLGNATDLEFIEYLVANSVALEQIVINPRIQLLFGTGWEFSPYRPPDDPEDVKMISSAPRHAKKLREKLQKVKPALDIKIL